MKHFKTFYIAVVALACIGALMFSPVRDQFVYYIYGYDPALINTSGIDAISAAQNTYRLRLAATYFGFLTVAVCFVFSCVSIYLRIFVRNYLAPVMLGVTLVLMLIFLVTASIPTRAF